MERHHDPKLYLMTYSYCVYYPLEIQGGNFSFITIEQGNSLKFKIYYSNDTIKLLQTLFLPICH